MTVNYGGWLGHKGHEHAVPHKDEDTNYHNELIHAAEVEAERKREEKRKKKEEGK